MVIPNKHPDKESSSVGLNVFEDDPLYKEIKSELDPLINRFVSLAKSERRYIQFKTSLDDWNKRFVKTLPTIGAVESVQRLLIPLMKEEAEGNHRLSSVLGLFRYLGLVESVGGQIVDLVVLLLVANGHEFHVEREHDVPRIIHATSLKDLRNAFLGPKVRFLERCKLKTISKIVDVDLRNSIAHLDFEIDDNGRVSARSQGERKKEINIFQKINDFSRKWIIIFLIFNEVQKHTLKPEKRLMALREK